MWRGAEQGRTSGDDGAWIAEVGESFGADAGDASAQSRMARQRPGHDDCRRPIRRPTAARRVQHLLRQCGNGFDVVETDFGELFASQHDGVRIAHGTEWNLHLGCGCEHIDGIADLRSDRRTGSVADFGRSAFAPLRKLGRQPCRHPPFESVGAGVIGSRGRFVVHIAATLGPQIQRCGAAISAQVHDHRGRRQRR
ncbi:hypothetical protein AU194_21000 [Mycobacterium sp. GA-2829]|nr:hypothetical protein AU194_21000 [Mycobacterium sp. GA-2829]